MISIYIIHNTINDKKYIGQTNSDIDKRLARHKCASSTWCVKLHNALNKYGKDNFFIELLSVVDDENKANELEDYFITKYDSINNGYNILRGGNIGEGLRGRHLSDEHKRKISEAQSGEKGYFWGKHHTIDTKKKISAAQIGEKHHNFGKITPQEIKNKISLSNSGENNGLSKLTWEDIIQIRQQYENKNITLQKLADLYKVTKQTIWGIVKYKTWKTNLKNDL